MTRLHRNIDMHYIVFIYLKELLDNIWNKKLDIQLLRHLLSKSFDKIDCLKNYFFVPCEREYIVTPSVFESSFDGFFQQLILEHACMFVRHIKKFSLTSQFVTKDSSKKRMQILIFFQRDSLLQISFLFYRN